MQQPTESRAIEGLKVLVFEDETLVALHLETILEDLGCAITGPVMRYNEAETLLESGVDVDAAILDVNFNGKRIFPLAEKLVEKGVPVIFATGYDRSGIPVEWRDTPMLQKPYSAEEIAHALRMV